MSVQSTGSHFFRDNSNPISRIGMSPNQFPHCLYKSLFSATNTPFRPFAMEYLSSLLVQSLKSFAHQRISQALYQSSRQSSASTAIQIGHSSQASRHCCTYADSQRDYTTECLLFLHYLLPERLVKQEICQRWGLLKNGRNSYHYGNSKNILIESCAPE